MNHDPTPTSPADPEPNLPRREDEDDDAADNSNGAPSGRQDGSASGGRPKRPKISKKAKAGLTKKLAFLIHLLMSLDAVIYAELCVLYYHEYVMHTPASLLPHALQKLTYITVVPFSASYFVGYHIGSSSALNPTLP